MKKILLIFFVGVFILGIGGILVYFGLSKTSFLKNKIFPSQKEITIPSDFKLVYSRPGGGAPMWNQWTIDAQGNAEHNKQDQITKYTLSTKELKNIIKILEDSKFFETKNLYTPDPDIVDGIPDAITVTLNNKTNTLSGSQANEFFSKLRDYIRE